MKRFLLVALFVFSGFLPVKQAYSQTLIESVQYALEAHPSVDAASALKDIAYEDYKAARSGFFPEISTGFTTGRVYGDTATSRGLTVNRGAAYSWLGEGSASLTQPLFNGFGTVSRLDAARARTESADFDIHDARESLAFRAAQAHLAVLQSQDVLNRTQSYYDVIEDYLSRVQLMVDEGVADESEAAQARNISLMLKSTLTDYEGQLNAALAKYQEVTGATPQEKLIKPVIAKNMIAESLDDALSYAQKNHPSIKAGEKKLEAATYDIKAEKSEFFPELDGEVSYLKRDQKEEIGGEVVDGRAVLKMSWDFEVGGGQIARTRKAKAQYSEILAQNQEVALTISSDIRRAYAEYETAKKQMELVKKREVVTKDLFEAYKTQFEGARVRLLQLMQAENQLFNAQLESITAEYRYIMAHYGVMASAGQLLDYIQKGGAISHQARALEEPSTDINMVESTPVAIEENKVSDVKLETDVLEVEPEPPQLAVTIEPQKEVVIEPKKEIISVDPLLDNLPRPDMDAKLKISQSISKETDVEIQDSLMEQSEPTNKFIFPDYKLPERVILNSSQ